MDRTHRTRVALFVDFDNLYLRLAAIAELAAEAFARNPERWLQCLVQIAGVPNGSGNGDAPRAILVRRCYLNPASFGRYRANFVRAGFEVIDCPPLTSNGKTAADMLMAIDILDTLQDLTHFDEFILLSGDADFTPVLHRLRRHDRRTMVVSPHAVSAAYRSVADVVVGVELFSPDTREVPRLEPAWPHIIENGSCQRTAHEHIQDWLVSAESVIADIVASSPAPVVSAAIAGAVAKALEPTGFQGWEAAGGFKTFVARIPNERFAIDWRAPGWFFLPERRAQAGLAAA